MSFPQRLAEAIRVLRTPHAPHPAPEHADPYIPPQIRDHILASYHAANLRAARSATERLVREGWHMGPVPYGYRPHRIRATYSDHHRRMRMRLVPDPATAGAVGQIFDDYVHHLTLAQIRHRLARSGYPAPAHTTTGRAGPWTSEAVKSVLNNPKYLGYQVWGRHHHGRPAPRHHWVWSHTPAHRALVDAATFTAAQQRLNLPAASTRRTARMPPIAPRP